MYRCISVLVHLITSFHGQSGVGVSPLVNYFDWDGKFKCVPKKKCVSNVYLVSNYSLNFSNISKNNLKSSSVE